MVMRMSNVNDETWPDLLVYVDDLPSTVRALRVVMANAGTIFECAAQPVFLTRSSARGAIILKS